MNGFRTLQARWQAWWPQLAPREQRMLLSAAALLTLACIWWVALAPALRTLNTAPAEHSRLDAQVQQMTALQAQARALQSQPRASGAEALRSLESTVRQNLGASTQIQGASGVENVTIGVRQAPAEALAQLLTQARNNARAVPREVHLTRSAPQQDKLPASAPTPPPGPSGVRWDGTLVMGLPAP